MKIYLVVQSEKKKKVQWYKTQSNINMWKIDRHLCHMILLQVPLTSKKISNIRKNFIFPKSPMYSVWQVQ